LKNNEIATYIEIQELLSSPPNSRVFNPDFGSNIHKLIFEETKFDNELIQIIVKHLHMYHPDGNVPVSDFYEQSAYLPPEPYWSSLIPIGKIKFKIEGSTIFCSFSKKDLILS